ncbi:MAG: PQQ-dependent sugar dehydrogenase, partial [Candidatus Nanohaloarchaea archaeon]|nr:PQQ-dependent sugar dehydrogenase [Candidatus Nanohaloarchaea archaeon]
SPWDLEFLPDGSALVTEKGGDLVRWRPGDALTAVGSVETLSTSLTGLMGLAVHPDFPDPRYVYLQYTTGWDEEANARSDAPFKIFLENRISRFKLVNGSLTHEKVLLDDIPGSRWRAGGRLEFGPDGNLYATTGDANNLSTAQDRDTLNGKILRIAPDGSVPVDNPFEGRYVYSRGHRNPQGLAWHPVTGTLYETEHGPWRHDELNRIEAGNNYGWGARTCTAVNDAAVTLQRPAEPPVYCFNNWTIAPSGITFVDDRDSPLHGDLLVAGLRGKHVHRFVFQDGAVVRNEIFYYREGRTGPSRRLRDVEYVNGSVWVIGETHGVARISLSP